MPFEVKISTLATNIEANRNTVLSYLNYLGRAKMLNLLYSDLKSVKKMQKPDKIYLENTNLLEALSTREANVGTVRETFVVNQLSYHHQIEYGKANGDFLIDGRYTFEVGGSGKSYDQIANLPDSFILSDDIDMPIGHKLPLWIVGLTY